MGTSICMPDYGLSDGKAEAKGIFYAVELYGIDLGIVLSQLPEIEYGLYFWLGGESLLLDKSSHCSI